MAVIGSIVEGVVTSIAKFGAFVDLGNGTVGLVHISEVADSYVKEISDYLKVGDKVRVKVVSTGNNGKTGLSIRQAQVKAASQQTPKETMGFEDKLAKFLKDSNEKLITLKRHQEGKKGK